MAQKHACDAARDIGSQYPFFSAIHRIIVEQVKNGCE
jgi:hypothetical protein